MLTAALLSFGVIFVAELGDKSQLMAMTFALRYRWWVVIAGITVATTVVHLVSVAVGHYLGVALPTAAISIVGGVAFLIFGAWTLRGDDLSEDEQLKAGRATRSAALPGRLPAPFRSAASQSPYEDARVAPGLQVGEDHRDGLADDAPAVDREPVLAAQDQPGVFEVHQFLGRHIDRDLLVVALPAAGPAVRATSATTPALLLDGGDGFLRGRRPGPCAGRTGRRGTVGLAAAAVRLAPVGVGRRVLLTGRGGRTAPRSCRPPALCRRVRPGVALPGRRRHACLAVRLASPFRG